jgi:cytochrome c2
VSEQKDTSLVVSEGEAENTPPETLAEALGGLQAAILFGVILVVALIVFALPTPFNPAVPPSDEEPAAVAVVTEEAIEEVEATEEAIEEVEATEEAVEEVEATEEAVEEVEATEEAVEESAEMSDVPSPAVVFALQNGDIANGEALFAESYTTNTGIWMCSNCHSVDEAQTRLVGPGLYGLYERTERLEASGERNLVAYIHKSISNPQAYVVPDDLAYPENLMPQNYTELLTEQEINDLAAYVLSLGNPDVDAILAGEFGDGEMGLGGSNGNGGQGNGNQGMGNQGRGGAQEDATTAVANALEMGDPARGAELFMTTYETPTGIWMCSNCHSVDESQTRLVGPGLYGLYANTERPVESGSPHIVAYIHQSISNPQAYFVVGDPEYPANLMPPNYTELLTEQDINDLTAYILTLGNPDAE